jgi:hypothetical protein
MLAGVGTGRLKLPNDNIDVGAVTKAGTYTLMDAAYAELLHKLENQYADIPEDLRSNILAFYQDLSLPIETKAHASEWARLQEELDHLGSIDRDLSAGAPGESSAIMGQVAK